jgi:AraC-like DNA-binding protein
MIALQYELTTYKKFLEDLSVFLDIPLIDHTLYFPATIGKGYIKYLQLPDKTEVLIAYFRLKNDFVLERKKDAKEYYTFCCEEISELKEFSMTIGADQLQATEKFSAMYLTSFLYDVGYHLKPDTQVSSIRMLLTPEWMRNYLGLDQQAAVLAQYLQMKTAGILYKKVDAAAREIMKELLQKPRTVGAPALFYQSRLLHLVEKFFQWMNESLQQHPHRTQDLSRHDIERMRKTELHLLRNLAAPPTIKELAKMAAISESKLKKLFKAVYGLPPYEYFQKHRMDKARTMLLTGQYSIKDVGYALGYTNLSNFTLAFKKAFGLLPSDLLK